MRREPSFQRGSRPCRAPQEDVAPAPAPARLGPVSPQASTSPGAICLAAAVSDSVRAVPPHTPPPLPVEVPLSRASPVTCTGAVGDAAAGTVPAAGHGEPFVCVQAAAPATAGPPRPQRVPTARAQCHQACLGTQACVQGCHLCPLSRARGWGLMGIEGTQGGAVVAGNLRGPQGQQWLQGERGGPETPCTQGCPRD